MAGILFLPVFPQGSPYHVGGLQSLMTVTSLFTNMAGNIPFLMYQKEDVRWTDFCQRSVSNYDFSRVHYLCPAQIPTVSEPIPQVLWVSTLWVLLIAHCPSSLQNPQLKTTNTRIQMSVPLPQGGTNSDFVKVLQTCPGD